MLEQLPQDLIILFQLQNFAFFIELFIQTAKCTTYLNMKNFLNPNSENQGCSFKQLRNASEKSESYFIPFGKLVYCNSLSVSIVPDEGIG